MHSKTVINNPDYIQSIEAKSPKALAFNEQSPASRNSLD